ncbi:MAG: UTP--glucose-1-phosphate uridylyltransferase, partial [Pyrinomonadaceae bacterium]|nr:UTP--glucose-1-phosphate uridylyltransferase [Pyrinomonadaceae bacterium]
AVESGINSIIIVTGRDKAAIENHFDISYELEQTLQERGKTTVFEEVHEISDIAKISYTRQKQPLGLGHAIYQAKDFVENEPFAVVLPDDIIDAEVPALQQMISVFEKYESPVIATMQIEGEAISRFGVIDAEEVETGVYRIKDMVEKPKFADAPSDLAIIGRYIFTPDIFAAIEKTEKGAGGEIQITDAMRILLKERPIYAVKIDGIRHDAGDKLGFLIATVEFALKREELAPEFTKYLKTLDLK